jgi:hypothetical protein
MLQRNIVGALSSAGYADWSDASPGAVTQNSIAGISYVNGNLILLASGGISYSANGSTWSSTTLSGTWNAVAKKGSDPYVVVGQGGAISTSTDLSSWTSRTSGTANSLRSIAANGTYYIAVGDAGVTLYSTAGTSWGDASGATTNQLKWVIWSGSLFVAVGASGTILTSTNGLSWTVRTSNTSAAINQVAWSGAEFVACRNGGFQRSTDGTAWSSVTVTGNWVSVKWDGAQFVALTSTAVVATSADGTSWTTQNAGITSQNISWLESAFGSVWAVGNNLLLESTTSFTSHSVESFSSALFAVAYSAGLDRVVAVGSGGAVLYSDDGAGSWNLAKSGTSSNVSQNDVVWGNSEYLLVGTSYSAKSSDGVSWTAAVTSSTDFYGVVWDGTQYVAVGTAFSATSAAGLVWSKTTQTGINFRRIAWSPDLSLYAAVASSTGARVLTSTNGASWTSRYTSQAMYTVCWGNGQFVAGGDGGTILTSSNGTTWTSRTFGSSATVYDIRYSNGIYIAVCDGGVIRESSDGITWGALTSGTSKSLRGVSFISGAAVAVGLRGQF